MFFSAPKDVYGSNLFELFMGQCGGIKKVAEFLHVSECTVKTWIEKESVPRAAVLALYWETNYGRSQMFTGQVNEIRVLYRRICILQDQYTKAKDIITGLRQFQGDTANEPFYEEMPDSAAFPGNSYGLEAPVLPAAQKAPKKSARKARQA